MPVERAGSGAKSPLFGGDTGRVSLGGINSSPENDDCVGPCASRPERPALRYAGRR